MHGGLSGTLIVGRAPSGTDTSTGWQSTDGESRAPSSFDPGEIAPLRIAQGWLRTGDQSATG